MTLRNNTDDKERKLEICFEENAKGVGHGAHNISERTRVLDARKRCHIRIEFPCRTKTPS